MLNAHVLKMRDGLRQIVNRFEDSALSLPSAVISSRAGETE